MLVTTLAVATVWVTFVPAESARAAKPKYCKFWRVQGQTWYASQDNGFTLAFTLKMPLANSLTSKLRNRLGGFARYSRGHINSGYDGVGSQLITGGVGSEGVGSIYMNIVWRNGTRGQYNARAVSVRRTRSGGLTAGLYGTTVDTTGNGGGRAAHWWADNTTGELGQTNHPWPLICLKGDVVYIRHLGR
jgi:hypothetical protein